MDWFISRERKKITQRSRTRKERGEEQKSKSVEELSTRSKEDMDIYLKEEKKRYELIQKEPKLLILGSSDSGKSTLLKQLQIIHGGGFSDEQKALAIIHIRQNIFSGCTYLISQIISSNTVSEPTEPTDTETGDIDRKQSLQANTVISRVPLKQDYSGL
jgi:hypothetical protein